MKILVLNYEYPPLGGGAANACEYILKEMSQKDMEIDLVTSSSTNKFEVVKIGNNTNIYKLAVGKKSIHYWTLREILSYCWKAKIMVDKLIRENHYDLCHAFFGIPCGAIAFLYKKKMPYIVSLRGSDVPGFNKRFSFQYIFLKPVIKMVWRNAGAVIANSEGLRDLALKTDPGCPIDIIYNGIDTSQFRPAQNKKNNGKLNILCVSRLIKRKGIEFLLRSIPLLKLKIGSDFLVQIVGEGNLEEELKRLSDELGISDLVLFKGYVAHENLPDIYASSDLFVLPSFNEGMSNTILEAMASGLPIISTATGGSRELINGNGFIIEKNSPEALIHAILKQIGDPQLMTKYGMVSRELAINFSWTNVVKRYVEVYAQLA